MYSVSSVVSQTAIMKTVIIEDKQRIESIILHCDACFVGITDLEGNPYVVPMNFGYENGIIYLHSGPEGSKLEMLEHNNNVCRALDIIMRHYTDSEFNYSDPAVRNVKVWQVRINQMTGKVFGLRANEKP